MSIHTWWMHSACARVIYRKFKSGKSLLELFFYTMFSKCSKWPHGKPTLIIWTKKKTSKILFQSLRNVEIERAVRKGATRNNSCAALVDMFSWTKMFSWTFVDVLEWIALDTVSKGERFTSANGLMATWWSGLQRLMKSVIAEDISLNCSNVGQSL